MTCGLVGCIELLYMCSNTQQANTSIIQLVLRTLNYLPAHTHQHSNGAEMRAQGLRYFVLSSSRVLGPFG